MEEGEEGLEEAEANMEREAEAEEVSDDGTSEAAAHSSESMPNKRLGRAARKTANRKRRRLLNALNGGHDDENYSVQLRKVLKELHPDIGITEKAMNIMDSFVNGLYEQLATEASRVTKALRRRTLSHREVEASVRVILPEGLAKRAMEEGNLAVVTMSTSKHAK